MAKTMPDTPITGDLSPAQVADLIDEAATLIESDGLEVGDYWTGALFQPYEPGMPCCTVGALRPCPATATASTSRRRSSGSATTT